MKFLILLTIVLVAAAAAGWWYWRKRREPEHRLISLVALLREPMTIDPAVLAKTAGRAWNADLGDGSSEGEDGFVAASGPINMVMCRGQAYLINCVPAPYYDDPETVAESMRDLRIRKLFAEHRAWFSCDVLGIDADTPEAEVAKSYQRLAKLFAEFMDENWLLIYVPDTTLAYALNDDTLAALEADDPLEALQKTQMLPVINIPEGDQAMAAAVAKAKETWPQFLSAFEKRAGKHFSVKAPVTHADVTEFIWLEVTAIEGEQIFGTLGNDPSDLGPLKLGSKVVVKIADLNDWIYLDPQDKRHGGFTVDVVLKAAEREK